MEYQKVLSDDQYHDLPEKLVSDRELDGFIVDDQHSGLLHRETTDSIATIDESKGDESDCISCAPRTCDTEHDTFLSIHAAPAAPLVPSLRHLSSVSSVSSKSGTNTKRSLFSNPEMHPRTHQISDMSPPPSGQRHDRYDSESFISNYSKSVHHPSLSDVDASALLNSSDSMSSARRHSRFSSLRVRPTTENESISMHEVKRTA